MDVTPTVPDGPDAELIRASEELLAAERGTRADVVELADHVRLARAVQAMHDLCEQRPRLRRTDSLDTDPRPAAGRDLTTTCLFSGGPFADCTLAVPRSELPGVLVTDVGDSRSAYVCIERNGETVYRYAGEASAGEWEACPRVPADAHVDGDARPAVARTDGQDPTAHAHVWRLHRNVTSKGHVLPAYEACWCGAARSVPASATSAAPADDTAAPGPIETAARQLYAAIVAEHQRGETFPMRVSVCTNGLREALGETYPDDAPAAGQPVRGSQGSAS